MTKSLQQKMALFLLLPVGLLLLSSWWFAFVFAKNTMLNEWKKTAILELQRAAHLVDMRLNKPIEWIEMFQKTGDTPGEAAVQGWILNELEKLDGVSHVGMDWAEGALENNNMMRQPQPMGGRGAMRFHRARIAEVTPPHYDTQTGQETVNLISNLNDESDRLIGTLKVVVHFDYLMQDIQKLEWWQGGEAYLVDDHGKYLAHTVAIMEGRSRLGENNNPLEIDLLQAIQDKPFGTVLGPGYPPEQVAGFYRIKDAPWTIILIAPRESILAPIMHFRSYFVVAGILSIFFIILLIRLVVGRMVHSIQDISLAAEGIAAGNYGSPLPVDRQDEIGQLRHSFNGMVRGLKERDLIRNTFGRYMDEGIAKELLSRPEAIRMGGEKREVAILMSDLRDFTPLSESLTPERTLRVLNRYFSHMIETIHEHRGIIVDFFGDAMLVFFDPFDAPVRPAVQDAVNCALEMQKTMSEVNAENRTGRFPELQMGIGVNAGEVVVGNIGSEARAKYGIVGAPVNLTQRIQSIAEAGEVVVSERIYQYACDDLIVKRSFTMQLKGIQDQVNLYSIRVP
jgi:class 3 adenylate cyclase